MVQLNIYVPANREDVIARLEEASRRLGRPKNELVLQALEEFLKTLRPELPKYRLGPIKPWRRAELYEP